MIYSREIKTLEMTVTTRIAKISIMKFYQIFHHESKRQAEESVIEIIRGAFTKSCINVHA